MFAFARNEYNLILRRDFFSFMHRAFRDLNPGTKLSMAPYLYLIADRLEQVRHGKIRRLIINLPPRNLKSHLASIAFPAWILGHNPSAQIICASYGQDLADKHALDNRKIMSAPWYEELFPTRLAPDKRSVADFMTIQKGSRMATSVNGVLTGRGGDVLIVDDPIKPEDALSASARDGTNEWFDSTLLSRLNNKKTGSILLIMQRLHQDDLVGHVLQQGGWEVLNLAAIAQADEAYGYDSIFGRGVYRRGEGEVLDPARETREMLEVTRTNIGEYNFSSQYQQTPIPVGGAMVKTNWLMQYDLLPGPELIRHVVQSWDTAMKPNHLNDFSVCTTWALVGDRYYLVHVFRQRLAYPELRHSVIKLAAEHRPDTILIEDKASGSALIQELKGVVPGKLVAYELPPNKDKMMRLHAQTDLFDGGKVYLPQQAPWLADYRAELTGFPGTKYDDQVDSTTQALDWLRTNYASRLAVWEKLGELSNVF